MKSLENNTSNISDLSAFSDNKARHTCMRMRYLSEYGQTLHVYLFINLFGTREMADKPTTILGKCFVRKQLVKNISY